MPRLKSAAAAKASGPRGKRLLWLVALVAVVVLACAVWTSRFGVAEDFADLASEYKYGSIGSDHPLAMAPVPYWIWKVLPDIVAPADAIAQGRGPRNGKKGYDAFGLVTEATMAQPDGFRQGQTVYGRPIGFSKRKVFGIDFVGVNCAFCHLTTLRETGDGAQKIVLGGTGNTVDIEQFFLYMFAALASERFTADAVMDAVAKETRKQNTELSLFERLVYRYVAVPLIPKILAMRESAYFDFISTKNPDRLLSFGPGRVDTWAVYKRLYALPPQRTKVEGIVDFPSVWNQKARAGMQMHWDGNTDVLEERNIVSALAIIGSRIDYLDFPRLNRIAGYINGLLPPRYEDRIPESFRKNNERVRMELAGRGEVLFRQRCASCHAPDGVRVGKVEPIEDLGTDGERLKDFPPELVAGLNRLGTDAWKMRNFKMQHGYVNNLLDGVWLRAPYLHNGSVPTLRDLLNDDKQRPKKFCRGNDVYDWNSVGFFSNIGPDTGQGICGEFYTYDTSAPGNSNGGHLYGTDLSGADKDALVEFLKTL
jgi:hypothetical protein